MIQTLQEENKNTQLAFAINNTQVLARKTLVKYLQLSLSGYQTEAIGGWPMCYSSTWATGYPQGRRLTWSMK